MKGGMDPWDLQGLVWWSQLGMCFPWKCCESRPCVYPISKPVGEIWQGV